MRAAIERLAAPIGRDGLGLIGNIGSLSVSLIVSRALLFLRDLVLARILGPVSYGLWTQMLVMFSYALHLPLGFQHTMSRDVPYYLGRSDYARAAKIQNTAFVVTLATAVLACVATTVITFAFGYPPLGLPTSGIVAACAVVVAQQVNGFFSIMLRAHQRFNLFSVGLVGSALLSLLLGVWWGQIWGATGAAAALGVAFVSVTGFWQSRSRIAPTGKGLKVADLEAIGKVAIPLFLIGLAGLLITSVDRLIVIMFYDNVQIGYYGLAFMATQSIVLVTTPIMQATHPKMMQSYGTHNNPKKIEHYLVFLTEGIGVGVAMLIGVVYLTVDMLIPVLLPDFVPAISTVQIVLIASALAAVASGANAFLVAINRQSRVLGIQVAIIGVQIVVIGSIARNGGAITDIAEAMVIANLLYAALSRLMAGRCVDGSFRSGIGAAVRTLSVMAYLMIALRLIAMLSLEQHGVVTVVAKLLLWAIVPIPVLWYLHGHIAALKRRRSMVAPFQEA